MIFRTALSFEHFFQSLRSPENRSETVSPCFFPILFIYSQGTVCKYVHYARNNRNKAQKHAKKKCNEQQNILLRRKRQGLTVARAAATGAPAPRSSATMSPQRPCRRPAGKAPPPWPTNMAAPPAPSPSFSHFLRLRAGTDHSLGTPCHPPRLRVAKLFARKQCNRFLICPLLPF